MTVSLRWLGGSPSLDWSQAQDGLWWALSSLGAQPTRPDALSLLPGGSEQEQFFTLDLGAVGFSAEALPAVAAAIAELQADPAVAHHGGVDVGRFLMRTLYEPWRYYAITGACLDRADWEALHLLPQPATYAVTDSLLVEGHRLIDLNIALAQATQIAFRAAEIDGDLLSSAPITIPEREVIDVMPNGQQRFAIYGEDDALRPASDPARSPAGQPGRCMWCHEGGLMIGQTNPPVPGYWTSEQFFAELALQQSLLQSHRDRQPSLINFADYHAHTWAELLVEEFLAPTPARLAREWGISEAEARQLDLETYLHEEYPALGPVYRRADVDDLLEVREGWRPVETLESARELDPDDPRLAPATLRDCTAG